jgi:hypothetical protein
MNILCSCDRPIINVSTCPQDDSFKLVACYTCYELTRCRKGTKFRYGNGKEFQL